MALNAEPALTLEEEERSQQQKNAVRASDARMKKPPAPERSPATVRNLARAEKVLAKPKVQPEYSAKLSAKAKLNAEGGALPPGTPPPKAKMQILTPAKGTPQGKRPAPVPTGVRTTHTVEGKTALQRDAQKRKDWHAEQAAKGKRGVSASRIMAEERLRKGPSKVQQMQERGVSARQASRPGYISTRGGKSWRKASPRELSKQRAKTPIEQQAERDWEVVAGGVRSQVGRAATLDEYNAQFEEMKSRAGEGASFAAAQIQKDYIQMMPPDVRVEYERGQEDIQAERESQQAAQKLKILTIAGEEAAISSEEEGRGMKLRTIQRKKAKAETGGRLEAQETASADYAEARRKREREAILNREATKEESAGNLAEAQQKREDAAREASAAAALELRAKNAERTAEVAGAERHAAIGVETGLVEEEGALKQLKKKRELKTAEELAVAEADTAEATERATIRKEKNLLKEKAALALSKAEELRAIEDALPPSRREKAATARSGFESSRKIAESLDAQARKMIEQHGKVVQGKLIIIPEEQLREIESRRDQAYSDMKWYQDQYSEASGLDSPPSLAPDKAKTINQSDQQRAASISYEKMLAKATGKGKFASEAYLSKGEASRKNLDEEWAKTGLPKEDAPHAVRTYRAPRDVPPSAEKIEAKPKEDPMGMMLEASLNAYKAGKLSNAKLKRVMDTLGVPAPEWLTAEIEGAAVQ